MYIGGQLGIDVSSVVCLSFFLVKVILKRNFKKEIQREIRIEI